ncbi:hypothetical protein MCOR25_006166 [Pyricularia grisea]|uniref:Membrane anchor Opy2 N-terminal domain-containing protein n=1 Tax=Pyricularia grisea TaxID=148305 RepID=A0A6P8BIA2_PYRGI|nr:uncharacterized protein PgNI_01539 [Pyricularia grisea]KAI6362530.1 hypothetical protein MCOR25_006166 [Pyricularia grisea]TLD16364.1 hypothetical protein PgNI_01539 [Pyricularia grisea]
MAHLAMSGTVPIATLLRRDAQCPDFVSTDCPVPGPCNLQCGQGQSCQRKSSSPCNCATNFCGEDPSSITSPSTSQQQVSSSSSGPSAGAIAGGVIGGVAAIGLITYLVWRFCIKTKRDPMERESWLEEKRNGDLEADDDMTARRTHRSSTHTSHSVASTVLTRASNIIQIAYIPGVTNRATPTSPTLLVPPVPPIPIAVSQASTPSAPEDQHFFMPSDLRPDSTYSAMTGYTDRTSFARTSYAPRSSIASTIYGKNAVIVAPAQTGMRAKPAMVSVKSGSGASSGSSTPPVPDIDFEKYGTVRPPSPANSTFSVGSTFLNNASAHTAMAARPQVVRVGSVSKKSSNLARTISTADSTPSSIMAESPGRSSAAGNADQSSKTDQGPFADPPRPSTNRSNKAISAVIQEATRRASQRDMTTVSRPDRERSPFGDEHVARD